MKGVPYTRKHSIFFQDLWNDGDYIVMSQGITMGKQALTPELHPGIDQ